LRGKIGKGTSRFSLVKEEGREKKRGGEERKKRIEA